MIAKHDLKFYAASRAWTKFHESNEDLFVMTTDSMFRIAEKFLVV